MTISLEILYEMYNVYIYFTAYLIGAGVSCLKKRKKSNASVTEKSIVLLFLFLIGAALSLIISKIPVDESAEIKKMIFGTIVALMIGFFAIGCTKVGIRTIKRFVSGEWFQKSKYGFAIFIIWTIQFLLQMPKEIVGWVECWYATNYSMGFGSRFLIGSILSLFYDEYLDSRIAWLFCVVSVVLLIAACSFMLGKVIEKSEHKLATGFLAACIIACPCSIAGYWTEENMGRLEMYTLLVTLVSVCGFLKCKKTLLKYGILVASVCVCNAIYQGYVFLYFPIIGIVLICEMFRNRFHRKDILCIGIVITCAGITFLLFQFGSTVIFETGEEMVAAIQQKSNVYITEAAIQYELFSSITDAYNGINVPFFLTDGYPREILFTTICLLSPVVIMGTALYLKCFEKVRYKGMFSFQTPYFWCLLMQLAILPQFLLNIDWGRWIISLFVVLFFGIFYMSYLQFEEMEYALSSLEMFLKRNYYVAFVLLVYLSVFPKFAEHGMRRELLQCFRSLGRLLGM